MAIYRFPNNVLTHDGQSTVALFGQEIIAAAGRIRAIANLQVIVGYHGDNVGNFDHTFNIPEQIATRQMVIGFGNVNLVWFLGGVGLTNLQIQNYCAAGNVFFTWCDSHTRVQAAMFGLGLGVGALI